MKSLGIAVTLVVVLGASIWGIRSCQREGWQQSLHGPFVGIPFTGDLANSPTSVLPIRFCGQLEVYQLPAQTTPVLALRSTNGHVQWARVLVPERQGDNGQTERAGVREFQLHRLKRDRRGYEVFVTCDWDWGGKEGGLIDLDSDYGFRSFRLSW